MEFGIQDCRGSPFTWGDTEAKVSSIRFQSKHVVNTAPNFRLFLVMITHIKIFNNLNYTFSIFYRILFNRICES